MNELEPHRAQLRQWLWHAALPLWAEAGRDRQGGGFYEGLSLAGLPEPQRNKRLRVQARQIYVFAHAHLLGWPGPALEAAEAGFQFMTTKGWDAADGGFVHGLAPDGRVIDRKRDTYDHAFALLALAWLYRATGSGEVLAWIDRTLDFIDRVLWEPSTESFRESVPDALPRRQNPHMHMLEAFLALHAATGRARDLARAEAMMALFERHFFRRQTGTLCEYFDARWQPLATAEGGLVEPGHHYEWAWLIERFAAATGRDHWPDALRLMAFAEAHGLDRETGAAIDVVRDDGSVVASTRRSWPQTEALKAHLAALRRGGGVEHAARAAAVCRVLCNTYLATVPEGLWQDQFDHAGRPLAAYVPASTLYHLMVAIVDLIEGPGAVRVTALQGANR